MAEPLRHPVAVPAPLLRVVPPPAAPAPVSRPLAPHDAPPSAAWSPPEIPYVRLRFWLVSERPFELPALPGSMLRGTLGNALRRLVCTLGPKQECQTCRLRRDCLYTRLFESYFEEEPPPFLRGLPTPPRPYVVESGAAGWSERTLAPGEPFPFELLLFGQAASLTAYALLAVERMGEAGLGWPRVPVRLERAEIATGERSWRTLFAGGTVQAMAGMPILRTFDRQRLDERPHGEAQSAPGRVRLHFTTPTRIQAQGHFVREPDPRQLAFAMIRRVLEVAHVHAGPGPGDQPLDWTFRPLLEAASRLTPAGAHLRWMEADRYSNRQRRKIPLDGFVGTLDLEGDLGPFLPLFESIRVLHVGKGATVGLGKVEWERVG